MKKLIMVWMILSLPAWAAETPLEVPHEIIPSEAQESAYIEIRGESERVNSLLDKLVKEEVFKAASCQIIPAHKAPKKSAKSCDKVVGIACAKSDCALMRILKQPGVQTKMISSFGAGCPAGCIRMSCPPFNGPVGCCKLTPLGYRACS